MCERKTIFVWIYRDDPVHTLRCCHLSAYFHFSNGTCLALRPQLLALLQDDSILQSLSFLPSPPLQMFSWSLLWNRISLSYIFIFIILMELLVYNFLIKFSVIIMERQFSLFLALPKADMCCRFFLRTYSVSFALQKTEVESKSSPFTNLM